MPIISKKNNTDMWKDYSPSSYGRGKQPNQYFGLL